MYITKGEVAFALSVIAFIVAIITLIK